MPNISDYMDWRGDLPLSVSPFNEVDNLILCKLVALDFTDIVPEDGQIPLREAAAGYFDRYGDADVRLGVLVAPGVVPLMKKLVESVRFGEVLLCDYVNHIDQAREEQFSAMTLETADGVRFVSFRGTDDTIVAWREDFKMGVEDTVPAQTDALAYLCRAAWRSAAPLRVGGHSKGGNLAVYAAMNAPEEVQRRILRIYNNDGPGFRESVQHTPEYRRIQPRLTTLVPQYSLVGMLLSHDDDFEIVRSTETGIAAHNGFTWEVLGTAFVRCEDFSLRSRVFDRAIHAWADDLDDETRGQFVDTFFDLLGSAGAVTLTDITEHKLRQALEMAQDLRQSPEQRQLMTNVLELLLREYMHSARSSIPLPKVKMPRVRLPLALRRGKKPQDDGSEEKK